MGNKLERDINKFMLQRRSKFTLEDVIDGLFLAIFAINGIYIVITFLMD
jgi:hypothetical protein